MMTAFCRHCAAPLTQEVCDFGEQPLANGLVSMDAPATPDPRFPLRVMVCQACLLVQLERTADPSVMFSEYSYLSAISSVWRNHVSRFATKAIDRFGLNPRSLVVEVGSNDGTLLKPFVARGIPSLGIDPAVNVAAAARAAGVPTLAAFFGERTAATVVAQAGRADLLVGNNVLAHAPDLNGFVRGLAIALSPHGVVSIEVPHVLAILEGGQFDTVYHEHVFYFSAFVLARVMASAGLAIFDVETVSTHGGSLRILAQHAATGRQPVTAALDRIIAAEHDAGLLNPLRYRSLRESAAQVVGGLRSFLSQAHSRGETVAAYGAAAKGTMLLNLAGTGAADVRFVVDANPLKQGHRLPGCRIPVVPACRLAVDRPDFVLILPWNIADEIIAANHSISAWGGRFVVPSLTLRVIEA
jgi:2-polyprenyl-3-methyl-5-hydroxy-6-metoxy-1,4-benzoquinol methylase